MIDIVWASLAYMKYCSWPIRLHVGPRTRTRSPCGQMPGLRIRAWETHLHPRLSAQLILGVARRKLADMAALHNTTGHQKSSCPANSKLAMDAITTHTRPTRTGTSQTRLFYSAPQRSLTYLACGLCHAKYQMIRHAKSPADHESIKKWLGRHHLHHMKRPLYGSIFGFHFYRFRSDFTGHAFPR